MNKFKFKFTKLMTALIYVGIALCIVGLGLNVYLLIVNDISSSANIVYPIIQHSLMFLIPVVLLIILISLLCSSYYVIDGKTFKTSFGIIKSVYSVEDIDTLLLDRTTEKLAVYFKNKNFVIISVREEWQSEFIDALCKANSDIEFSIKSKEPDQKDEK